MNFHSWTVNVAPPCLPLRSSLMPTFPSPSTLPRCKFLHWAQDAQSINKTLSPPLGAPAQEATQEQAGLFL